MVEISAFMLMFLIILTFDFHVVLLAIEVILALLIPLLVYFSKKPHKYFKGTIAKRYMRYIAITYAAQQVFLTASTVFMLSFFPEAFVFLGRGLYYTWIVFILLYAFRLFLIAIYWYGWDSLPENIHHFVGTFFAFTGVGLIYLDSVILGFLSNPIGITSVSPLSFNFIINMVNPLAIPLFIALVLFAITVTLTMLGFIHAIRVHKIDSLEIGKEDLLGRIYFKVASVTGLLLIPSTLWYLLSLQQFSPYKFSNMVGGLGIEAEGPNLSWLFILSIVFFTIFIVSANIWNRKMEQLHSLEHVRDKYPRLIYVKVISIIVSFLAFFVLNMVSQSPYIVSDPKLAEIFPFLDTSIGINQKAAALDVVSVAIFALVPFISAFAVLLYFFFTGVIGDEKEIAMEKLAGRVYPLK